MEATHAEPQTDQSYPNSYKAVTVWLSDGNRATAMWTGSEWWGLDGRITQDVLRWEATG